MILQLLNLKSSGYRAKNFINVHLLYENGLQVAKVKRPTFKPYCFINAVDQDKLPVRIEKDYEFIEGSFETYQGNQAVKVVANVPRKIRAFRDAANSIGIEVFEADVPYSRMTMIENDYKIASPQRLLYWDIEVDSREEFPRANNPHQRIILIGAIDPEGNEYVFSEENEAKMITDFIQLKNQFEATCGWFSGGFDIPYLVARAGVLGLKLSDFNFPDYDLLKIYKKFFSKKQQSYALAAVVEKICEYHIEDWGEDGSVKKMYGMFENKDPALAKYCLKQIRAVKDINEKLLLTDMWCQICETANLLPYAERKGHDKNVDLPGNSKIIDNLVLKTSINREKQGLKRIVYPTKVYDTSDATPYLGGYVKDPVPGIWKHVVNIDAAQQYPAIINTFNIGLETYCSEKIDGNVIARHGSFKQEPQSVLAQIVTKLSEERYVAKRKRNSFHPTDRMYDIWDKIQFGKKFITNSVYGICGFPGSRYFKREIAENITSYARAILMFAEQFMKEKYTTLYGDTDSVFMTPKFEYKDVDDMLVKTDENLNALNAALKKAIHKQWNVPNDRIQIHFEYDTIFEKIYLTSKKKCYAGKVFWQNGKFIEPYTYIRGFETVRNSTLKFVRDIQSQVFELLLSGSTTRDIVEMKQKMQVGLMKGDYDESLYFMLGLNKPIEEYSTSTAQVKAAQKLISLGKQVRVGDKIKFVRGEGGKIILPGEHITTADRKFIWNNYVENVFKRLDICETYQSKLDT